MTNLLDSSKGHTMDDTPLSPRERVAIYELLRELCAAAKADAEAPPLTDLFASVVFTDIGDGQVRMEGVLRDRAQLHELLTPNVIAMVESLPDEKDVWLLVVDHPQGVGVFHVSLPALLDTDVDVYSDLAQNPAPIEGDLSSFELLREQLGTHLQLNHRQCVLVDRAVQNLCEQWASKANPPPSHEVVAALRLSEEGTIHGLLVEYRKMLQIVGPPTQELLQTHTGRVPGRMLVMLSLSNGQGGIFSIDVQVTPKVTARGSQGVLN